MSIYPAPVQKRSGSTRNDASIKNANAVGRSANFECGSFVGFDLLIELGSKTIESISFRTNGCGYMIASADTLADLIRGRRLGDLHGLEPSALVSSIESELEVFATGRRACALACIDALRRAFSDFRQRQMQEFSGEKALICTCFGVSEETIENIIMSTTVDSVEEITAISNAGSGCGSCRMLIQEMLDASRHIL